MGVQKIQVVLLMEFEEENAPTEAEARDAMDISVGNKSLGEQVAEAAVDAFGDTAANCKNAGVHAITVFEFPA